VPTRRQRLGSSTAAFLKTCFQVPLSRRLKRSLFSPANLARRDNTFSRASFSAHQKNPQRGLGRLTNSAVRTDLVLPIRRTTVRPSGYACGLSLAAALLGWDKACPGRRVCLADSGRAGEITAWVGRVGSLAFLCTTAGVFCCCAARLSSSQAHVRTVKVLACQHSFSTDLLGISA